MLYHRNLVLVLLAVTGMAYGEDAEPVSPKGAAIQLFNGKNLDGLYTWLSDAKYADPRKVFTVEDGMIHISGDGFGYVCTKQRYKDYHLVLEYRWGERTWRERKTMAKDSGVIVHCVEPDGSWQNMFMAGIEAQIIEGGTGDFIVVYGKRGDGSDIPVSLTAEIAKDRDRMGQLFWKKGGQRMTLSNRNAWRVSWYGHDPDWKDVLGYRGKRDIDSPGKEWTRLDVICDGGHIIYNVNGIQANEGFDTKPSSGKILIQSEGAEVYVRRFELQPLNGRSGAESRVAPAAEPTLTKLPEKLGADVMESTPIVFKGRQLLFHSRRPPGDLGKLLDQTYLFVRDVKDGAELSRFGQGHSLGCAFVEGDTVHAFAAEATKADWFRDIHHFWSTDLKTWNRELAVPREGKEHLLNSSFSLTPVTWVLIAEIFPNRIRGAAVSVAVSSLWIACFILTYTLPILNRTLGPAWTFWLYAAICTAGFVFILLRVPETKGKSLEEIERDLAG